MKKYVQLTILFLSFFCTSTFAKEKSTQSTNNLEYLKNNSSLLFGAGVNYYNIEEKDGNNEKKFMPVISVGYKLNAWKGFFLNTNLIFDTAKLKSKFQYSEIEICDAEDVLEGDCSAVGSYKKFSGQKIDSYRFFDVNVGYKFNYGISIFAGLNLYSINEKYTYTSYSSLSGGSQPLNEDKIDDEDSIKLGFGLGVEYFIPKTNFGLKFAYNKLSFNGGNIEGAGIQKVNDNRFLFSLLYEFNFN